LRTRTKPPRLRGSMLELDGQPDYKFEPEQHDPDLRAAQAVADGLDLALVSLSSPLGIELLAADEADELLEAYHEGALALPPPFRAWAAARVTDLDPGGLERQLARGFVGLQLPATALLDDRSYAHLEPLLLMLEETGRPLFVHPGPAATRGVEAGGAPAWWPAIVDYAQQMHASWYAFRAFGRPRHPRLRACFAMLAGLAPLHGERFAARTGERSVVDSEAFLEVSSYGTRAVDATVRVLGIDVLVNGSDRPYAEPVTPDLGPAARFALRSANPIRLLDPMEVSDGVAIPAGAQS
jgi:6-methylsalicylate decarboxylase